jgi:hypothetical protein
MNHRQRYSYAVAWCDFVIEEARGVSSPHSPQESHPGQLLALDLPCLFVCLLYQREALWLVSKVRVCTLQCFEFLSI